MSSPTSTKLWPPLYIDGRIRRRYLVFYLLHIWISLLPSAFCIYIFFLPSENPMSFMGIISQLFSYRLLEWQFYLIVPLFFIFLYALTVIWVAFLTKTALSFLTLLHKPRTGVFRRDLKDKDYKYWNLRNYARLFLYWLLYSTPFTLFKKSIGYRFMGVKIGKDSAINHAWISPEFVKIGKNVKIAPSAAIYSFMFEYDKLLVAPVIIEDNVIIGELTVVLPGCKIREGGIIEGGSFLHPFTETDPHVFYSGLPIEAKGSTDEL